MAEENILQGMQRIMAIKNIHIVRYFYFYTKNNFLDEVESILKFYGYSTEYSGNPRAASNPLNLKMKSGLYREPEYWGLNLISWYKH